MGNLWFYRKKVGHQQSLRIRVLKLGYDRTFNPLFKITFFFAAKVMFDAVQPVMVCIWAVERSADMVNKQAIWCTVQGMYKSPVNSFTSPGRSVGQQ